MSRGSQATLVALYQALPGGQLTREIARLRRVFASARRQLVAAETARRRQRRKGGAR